MSSLANPISSRSSCAAKEGTPKFTNYGDLSVMAALNSEYEDQDYSLNDGINQNIMAAVKKSIQVPKKKRNGNNFKRRGSYQMENHLSTEANVD